MNDRFLLAQRISAPSDLVPTSKICFNGPRRLRATARTRIRLDCHWLREEAGNLIGGETCRRVLTPAIAEIETRLDGGLRTEVNLEENGRLRVRVLPAHEYAGEIRLTTRVIGVSGQPGAGDVDPLLALLLGAPGSEEDFREGLGSFPAYLALPAKLRRPLSRWFGEIRSEADFTRLQPQLDRICRFRDRLYQEAFRALERKCSVTADGISVTGAGGVLVDCCFAFTDEGLARYRELLDGELSGVLRAADGHARCRRGLPPAGIGAETALEMHLPFVDKKRWAAPMALVAGMEIEAGEDGRILARYGMEADAGRYDNLHQIMLALAGGIRRVAGEATGEDFRLSFTDRRRVPAGYARRWLPALLAAYGFPDAVLRDAGSMPVNCGDATVSLTLFVPGWATLGWRELPGEKTLDYYAVFSQVSEAVQAGLRRWLPYVHFSDPGRFRDKRTAYPLLVYAASRPFHQRTRAEYTYDPLNRSSLNLALRNAASALPGVLKHAEQALLDLGMEKIAGEYAPKRATRILSWLNGGNRNLQKLLAADALAMNQLENLGIRGRKLGRDLAANPDRATHFLLRSVNQLLKNLHPRLRRYYAGADLTTFGSLILVEATSALSAALGRPAPVQAVVRWRPAADAAATEQVAVNFIGAPGQHAA